MMGFSFNNNPRIIVPHTFHDAATTTGDGTKLTLNGKNKLILNISGTSTSRTITFKIVSNNIVSYTLGSKVTSTGDITLATNTTGTGEVWEISDLAGYDEVYCSLDAVAGGNVTVKGKLVD